MKKFSIPRWRFVFSIFSVLLFSLFMGGCKKSFEKYYNDTGSASGYAIDKLKQDTVFSMFVEGVERLGLDKQINSGGLYTIFAPVNNAFRSYLSARGYPNMAAVPEDSLFRVLNYHITNNLWYYYSLGKRYATERSQLYLTRGGKFVDIAVNTGVGIDTAYKFNINGVPIIKKYQDISADNAAMHGIGEVLVPRINLEQLLSTDSYFKNSTFYKLVQVLADSTFDRLNSFDRNHDGLTDSVFYKSYPFLSNFYTSVEYLQSTVATIQGGQPVFNYILMPIDDSLNAFIAPALARIDNSVTNKIAALSPTYIRAVLSPYYIREDSANAYTSSRFINKPAATFLYSTGISQAIPTLTVANFVRPDNRASNGLIHLINRNFPVSDFLNSGLGQASMDPNLSMFCLALQKAGLTGTYSVSSKAATLFAPTNAAFEAARFDVKNMTLDGVILTQTIFNNIIRNHIIDANYATPASLTGNVTTLYANTNQLIFTAAGTTVTTNHPTQPVTATIAQPFAYKSVTSTNGYIYKIDKILIPNQ